MRKVKEVKMEALKRAIRWRGLVRLYQLREDDESLLAEIEHPPGSGVKVYVCATSALMFCQKTGRCVQSTSVELLLGTVSPALPRDFSRYMAERKKRDYGRSSRHLIVE